ncbi:hypothetical protein DYU11_01755 [Fibrisoma montanum]|uniref:UPF0323 domain-containing protein n=1 Tax=Fibrisoma montanum TaxID=2305895 RepID=A0A418MI22_9BACT|nr:hypothetical protein [Fibrisoma montanum]RIV27066.1 hypothetical protein DYU11_01755 [Fibrisoma montanum]
MTPLRQHAIIRRVKDITLSTTLSIALLNGSVLLQSCGNSQSDSERATTEQTDSFRQGVRTYITETAPGNFKITDEQQVDPGRAGAIVNYYDGHRDTLSVEAARRLVQNDPSTSQYFNNPASYGSYHSNGLANALLWGGLGYMIGRSTAPRFRDDERRYASGIYANRGLYDRTNSIRESVRSSRVTSSRPSGGRSGFFGGSRSRGFSS